MTALFISVLLAAVCLECRAQKDNVLQPKDMTGTEGQAVTLDCQYNTSSTNEYLFWYKQDGNNNPKFILSRFKFGQGETEDKERFSSTLNSTSRSVPLKIQKLQLSDSAVYYCALQPNAGSGGFKLIFGSGTRLTIEPKDDYEPSYYKLGDGDHQVCLATDFSKHDVNKNLSLFSGTEPVLMENLYSQVAFLSKGRDSDCDEESGGSGWCEDLLGQDPMVNLMSLTVLGLRLLFLKTIVFNVLMTFRLWISQ